MQFNNLINICLVLLFNLTASKYQVAMKSGSFCMNRRGAVKEVGVGLVHFKLEEYEIPDTVEFGNDKSIYQVELELGIEGILYDKEHKNGTQEQRNKSMAQKIVFGDYVRFLTKDKRFNLGMTPPLERTRNFKDILNVMNDKGNNQFMKLNRNIPLIQYDHEGIEIWDLYDEFTSHKAVITSIQEEQGKTLADPVVTMDDQTGTMEHFIESHKDILILLNATIMDFTIGHLVEPLFLKEMDPEDRDNEQLEDHFLDLKVGLTAQMLVVAEEKLKSEEEHNKFIFNKDSFGVFLNEYLSEGHSVNILIETVMMTIARNDSNLIVEIPTEAAKSDPNHLVKIINTVKQVGFALGMNLYKYWKSQNVIKMDKELVMSVKGHVDDFNAQVANTFGSTQYAAQFERAGKLTLPTLMTNFGPELLEIYFWLFQTDINEFLFNYLLTSGERTNFRDFFVTGTQMDGSKVAGVWKYFHPENFMEDKVKYFHPIRWKKNRLI